MKTFKLFTYLILGIFILGSCDKDETKAMLSSNPSAPVLKSLSAGQNIVFTVADKGDTLSFIWDKAKYGANLAVTYKVEFDLKGNNFANAKRLVVDGKDTLIVKVPDLNNLLLGLQPDPEVPVKQELDVRVVASANNAAVADLTSAVVNAFFTPYYEPIVYPMLWVPGGYQSVSGYGNDWTHATAPTLASKESDGVYEGYVYFDAVANFKFTSAADWSHTNYGVGAPGKIDTAGGDIPAPGAGYFKVNVSVPDLTYNMTKTEWGLIGDATGSWDVDQNLTYNKTTKVWSITLDLIGGKYIKFRANDSWTLNYGLKSGKLTEGGDNILVAADGNYTVTLDLSNAPNYKYKIVKN